MGVTYTIHLSDSIIDEIKNRSVNEAIERTVESTGSTVMGAATTTIGGFGVLIPSSMPPIRHFG